MRHLTLTTAILISLFSATVAHASTSFLGTIEAEGTHFAITDSEYLNVALESSESISIRLESVPNIVTLAINAATTSLFDTTLTMSGFLPNTTYYKYTDNYHNLATFTTNETGTYSYTQDISTAHIVFIQTHKSTKFLRDNATGGDCATVGIWNSLSKTCTLTQNIFETVQIDSDNITLDGNNFMISGINPGYGVYMNGRSGVTIKNLQINNFVYGVYVINSNNIHIQNNNITNNRDRGIFFSNSNNNTIAGNTLLLTIPAASRRLGIALYGSGGNLFQDNVISFNSRDRRPGHLGVVLDLGSNNNRFVSNVISNVHQGILVFESLSNLFSMNEIAHMEDGVVLYDSSNNVLHGNTIQDNLNVGLKIFAPSTGNQVYNNNFLNNTTSVINSGGAVNVFNFPAPLGGNFWDTYNTPLEGCDDVNLDGFCDTPRVFIGGQDNLPWTTQDGWKTPLPIVCTENCNSNVLFLPGLQASRLYEEDSFGFEHRRWEPRENLDVKNLFLDETGKHPASPANANAKIYTRDVIDEAYPDRFGFFAPNIYKSFIAKMNTMTSSGVINEWQAIPYDWRLAFGDILASGKKDGQNISYMDATSSPYIIQEIKRLAAASKTKKVTIIAHSNGGLLAKALLQQLGDEEAVTLVDNVIFVASPQSGTPQAIGALLHGYKLGIPMKAPLSLSPDTARALAKNLPGAYTLLPSDAYFHDVETPVVTFDTISFFAGEIAQHGTSIESTTELSSFLLNSGSNMLRANVSYDDTKTPAVLNSIIQNNSSGVHETIDDWVPPSTIKVYQIAGWGIDTLATIHYKEKKHLFGDSTWNYGLGLTEDGDGTVVVPSALQLSTSTENVSRWWVNLAEYNDNNLDREHADILEIDGLQDYISNIITNNSHITPASYISTTRLTSTNQNKRLRFFLHSPLSLELYDDNGNYTGISTTTGLVDHNIPSAYYGEFGEVKYITAPASTTLYLVLNGQAAGSFTLEIQEVSGDNIIATTTFANIPSSTSTIVTMNFPSGIITNASPLRIDTNGDGVTDHSISAVLGAEVTMPKPKLTVTAQSKTMILGSPLLPLTATLSGFVDGDTESTSVTGSPECTTTGTMTSSVGDYSITCTLGTLVSEKYVFDTFATGTLTILYKWDGFLQPINDTTHSPTQTMSVFKGGSTVPVKFQLKNASGTPVQSTSSPIWLTPQRGAVISASVGESTHSDPATSGTTFRWDDAGQQYIYNWSTKGFEAGYWYRIYAKLEDGTTQSVVVGIR